MRNLKKTFSVLVAALLLVTAFMGYAPVKAADVLPEVVFVGVEHSPLVVGDKENFTFSTNYSGQVQYQVFMTKEGTDVWTDITNGYLPAVDGKTPYEFKYDKAFELGQYRLAVRVKKANVKGTNSNKYGDYDTAYGFALNCVDKDDANRVYVNGKLNVDKETLAVGETLTVNGIDGIKGMKPAYTYKIHVYNVGKDQWTKNVTDYVAKPTWTPTEAGTYVLDVWATSSDSKAPYESWKLKVITVVDSSVAAETAVAALEKAAKADLTVAANLKAAQDAVKPATDAVAKVTDKAKADAFAARIKTATTAIDKAAADAAYAVKLNATSAQVVSFEKAVADLSTQAKIDAATSASVIDLKGLKDENAIAFTIRIDAAKATLDYGKKLFSASSAVVALEKAVADLSTQDKIDAATQAAVAIKLDGLKDADKAALQARVDAANAKIAAAQGIKLTSTVEKLTFGSRLTISTTYPGAVKYQVFDAAGVVTPATALGTAANIYPDKVAGDKVTVKLLDAAGTVLVSKDIEIGKDAMIAKPAPVVVNVAVKTEKLTFGSRLTVTSDFAGAAKYQVLDAAGIVTPVTVLGQSSNVYPDKVAGDKVSVKLLDANGNVLQTVDAVVAAK